MIRNPRDGLPSSDFQNRYPVNSGIVGSNPTLSANSYNPKYLPAIELWKVRRTDERLVSQWCPFRFGSTLRFGFLASPSLQQRLAAVPLSQDLGRWAEHNYGKAEQMAYEALAFADFLTSCEN